MRQSSASGYRIFAGTNVFCLFADFFPRPSVLRRTRRRMGGFVLLHIAPGEDRSLAQAAALAAFARMGMPAPRLVQGANFLLALYPKRQASEPALQQFP